MQDFSFFFWNQRRKSYKNVGDTAATVLSASSVGGLDVEPENASSITAKTRHRSYLTAQWVNGESWRVLPPENLIPDLGVCSLVRVFRLIATISLLFDYASLSLLSRLRSMNFFLLKSKKKKSERYGNARNSKICFIMNYEKRKFRI